LKIYDISLPVSESLPVWPGDPRVMLTLMRSIAAGDPLNMTKITMGAHTGTHVDAPFHFFAQGKTVADLALEACIGPCLVIQCDCERLIEKKDLEQYDLDSRERVLFKTRNSLEWAGGRSGFRENYVALGAGAASYLAKKKIKLAGIDYLSIEEFGSAGNEVHKILLASKIVILEGLNLSSVAPGQYELICLPLKIEGADGSPARAVLREL
jgi:arylformamidase